MPMELHFCCFRTARHQHLIISVSTFLVGSLMICDGGARKINIATRLSNRHCIQGHCMSRFRSLLGGLDVSTIPSPGIQLSLSSVVEYQKCRCV